MVPRTGTVGRAWWLRTLFTLVWWHRLLPDETVLRVKGWRTAVLERHYGSRRRTVTFTWRWPERTNRATTSNGRHDG